MLVPKVWRSQPGQYFFLCTKDRSGEWKEHFFKRIKLREVQPFIEANLDKDVYWCPHGFNKPRRLKSNAALPKLLWADIDETDIVKLSPMPTIAWESSPGRYAGLWRTDKTVTEDLNRRLSYFKNFDMGGWDITQVLRVPGTSNYKYDNIPTVKLLWDDGPSYDIADLEKLIPQNKTTDPKFGDAHVVYKRYEKLLSRYARREILNGRPKPGKRSDVLWRLNNECLEVGMTSDEAFILLSISPWNKFATRRNGAAQLRRELDKTIEAKTSSRPITKQHEEEKTKLFLTKSIHDVEEEQINWLWYPYLAKRELTILEGDPGLGKSYLAQIVGAALVDGRKLPVVKAHKPHKGVVAYFDMENSAGTVTKRRLTDNGCENMANYYQEEQPFMIDDEDALDAVYEALDKLKPSLVVFDTINTYIGRADTYKAAETQQALGQFLAIAKRFNCSVMVLRHLTKSTKEKALYRGQGSIAFTGLARVVMTVGQHPDDPETRVMAVTKLNVTRRPHALTFTISALPDTIHLQDRSKFEWGEFVDLQSDDIIGVQSAMGDKDSKNQDVEGFLRDILSEGPVKLGDVQRAAEARGIGMKTVRRRADELGIVRESSGFGAKKISLWSLPSSTSGSLDLD